MSQDLIRLLNATGGWWMIGKGKFRVGEPLYGCIITEARIDGAPLAKTEGDDLADCVVRALAQYHDAERSE